MSSHKSPLFLLRFLSLFSVSLSDDAAVMFKLLASISPAPPGWSISKDPCTWTNVHCDNSTSNVLSINLNYLSISGKLPSDITQLVALQSLSVMGNSLSVSLPSFANMSYLKELYLNDNQFSSIPQDFLLGLPSLQTLSISNNANLSPWQIPSYLTESTYLKSFLASNASIIGSFPDFFVSLPSLHSLVLPYNNLTGPLPAFSESSEIKNLVLNNQLEGLSGPLPSFANMSYLENLRLDGNQFSSIPQDFLFNLPSLKKFSISDNGNLSHWQIPIYLTASSYLRYFHARNANIIGSIPDFFDSLQILNSLELSYNNLTGSLPESIGRTGIQNLRLNNQQQGLSGTIDVLSSMTKLSQAMLFGNAFTGLIPDLSKCTYLNDLELNDNQFTGVVPVSIMGLRLASISLQNNKLQGPVPQFGGVDLWDANNSFCKHTPGPCDPQVTMLLAVAGGFGYPMRLAQEWQGNDACQNWRFITCDARSKDVTDVDFRKQHFSGAISPALANLTSLRNLYLNDNNLTGPIPMSLTTLPHLEVLDVSNNNLSGVIPRFRSSVKVIIHGNLFLKKDLTTDAPNHNPTAFSISAKITVGVVIAVVAFVVMSYTCYKKRCHKRSEGKDTVFSIEKTNNQDKIGDSIGRQTSLAREDGNTAIPIQILQKATNYFSRENVLGNGGYGVVYMGELDDGTKVAVKRMKDGANAKAMNEFQSEINFLSKVRHRNLVSLLGYCMNDNERILVYEYMPQGTLSHHLFEWQKYGFDPLTWEQRVTIALDVARGIEYLHSLTHQSFIHRDIKPSNILLGDDMRAKVADFGLVRMAPDDKSSVETRVAGTFGYLAPDYACTGRATTKVDVYAFGVVLMEIITGKKAVDETLPDELCHLVTWFRKVIKKGHNVGNAIDPTLDLEEQTFESISKAADLAIHCTASKSFQRPTIEHVVNVLGPLVQKWKPLRREEIEESYVGLDLHNSLPLMYDVSSTNSLSIKDVQFNRYRLNESAQF